MRFYGLDLQHDLGSDRLSWRRLAVLLRQLPRESATVRAAGGEAFEWGYQEHLLASLIDAVANTNWILAAVNSKQRPPQPAPVPRPGQQVAGRKRRGSRKTFTPAQLDTILSRVRDKG